MVCELLLENYYVLEFPTVLILPNFLQPRSQSLIFGAPERR